MTQKLYRRHKNYTMKNNGIIFMFSTFSLVGTHEIFSFQKIFFEILNDLLKQIPILITRLTK